MNTNNSNDVFIDSVCFLRKAYKTKMPSVAKAFCNSTIDVDGIHCVVRSGHTIKTIPYGMLLCAHCNTYNVFNANRMVYSVRNGWGGGELIMNGLICEDCVSSDEIKCYDNARFTALCHEDYLWDIKKEAQSRLMSKFVKKWQKYVKLRKERRDCIRNVSFVMTRKLDSCNVTRFLDVILKQFNIIHCMMH